MKKHLLSLFAIVSMLWASSCSQEEVLSQSTGNEVKVTFTTELRNDVKSRAVGDNTANIDELIFTVYDENETLLPALTQSVSNGKIRLESEQNGTKTATIEVVLVKGQTYSFAFWAQNKKYTAYTFDKNTAQVSITYPQNANQVKADAFFAGITNYKVTGTFTENITLKRPFAQINFLTTQSDFDKAKKAGFVPDKSKIVVENAANCLNVLTGEVEGEVEATFDLSNLISKSEITNIYDANEDGIALGGGDEPTNFRYLATAYFLPTKHASDVEITASMTAVQSGSTKAPVELTAPNITARRNYRTNIYGNLLTSNGTFSVVIDPEFDNDVNVESDEFTETYSSLGQALIANVEKPEALTYNIESATDDNLTSVDIKIPAGTAASSLTFNLEDLDVNATINISNGENGNYVNPVVIEVPQGVELGNVTVNLPNAHVTLKQGTYTEVISSTSSTTLVVSEGTEIETLTVKKGNVRIAGGTVSKIERAKENPDKVTYVIYEGDKPEVSLGDGIVLVPATEFEGSFVKVNDDLYEIGSSLGLSMFRDAVNEGNSFAGKTIKLNADIDLESEEWTPIGTSSNIFKGTFDGDNHIISNLVVLGDGKSNMGLFGVTHDGEIKNLTVHNAKVQGRLNVAVVAGQPYTSKYTNITVKGHVEVNGMAYVGGVGGKNAYADWTNITVDVDESSYVNANSVENGTTYRTYVGGVVGFNGEGSHSFKNITSNIDVKGSTIDVGGLFGIAHYNNKFENCSSSGDVEIENASNADDAEEIGGIAGVWHNENGTTVTFTNCSFTGTLKTNITEGVDLSNNLIAGKAYNTTGTGKLVIDGVYTLQDLLTAIENASAETPIKLMNDIVVNNTITIKANNSITLDLNGHTITGTDNSTGSFGLINNKGNLTICNSNGVGNIKLTATNNRGWNAYSSVISNNPGGNLTVNSGVVIEHCGGTDMAYGIDNLTNGKGTSAVTTINGATVKSNYRAIRQFLNGIEATNELYVNSGIIEGSNKSIWMQDPSAKANTGKLVVKADAQLKGDVYLFVTAGSTEWPVEVSIAASALVGESKVSSANVPEGLVVKEVDGSYVVAIDLKETFEENSWKNIIYACQNNAVPSTWNVGDIKTMKIGDYTYDIAIIGKNHDDYTAGGKAPLTFQLFQLYGTDAQMNETQDNTTGWSGSKMRNTTMAEILSVMPSEVQNAIKAVDKVSLNGTKSALETTSDKLFLLSEIEVNGSTYYSGGYVEGARYAYYVDQKVDSKGNIISQIMKASPNKENKWTVSWYLRTPMNDKGDQTNGWNTRFIAINGSGYMTNITAEIKSGLVFGFCF